MGRLWKLEIKMKTSKIVIALFIGTLLFITLVKFEVVDFSASPSANMQIPVSEMQSVVEKAHGGDLISTNRLVNHHLFSEGDESTGLQWARLAAEQGDLDSQKFVVDVLSRSELDGERKESKKLAERWNLHRQ